MNADVHSQDFAIAIIGGGAGGVLTALHALRLATAGTRIVMIEPATRLARVAPWLVALGAAAIAGANMKDKLP